MNEIIVEKFNKLQMNENKDKRQISSIFYILAK